MAVSPQDRSSELVQLMMKHQRRLFAYIMTLVPTRADAEDILQEASLTICEKFSEFKLGTNFYFITTPVNLINVNICRNSIQIMLHDKVNPRMIRYFQH